MAKSWNRTETWIALIVLPVGLLLTAILGLWAYVGATSTPLHPKAEDVPSTVKDAPAPAWADAVRQAQRTVRADLTEQNLPGVSVAVGVGEAIVWAEGFGWADIETRTRVTPATRFRVGTASTVLTSAGVGLLLERGSLKLEDQIQTHVPEFPKKKWPVTLRHLMGHVAGIVPDEGDEEPLSQQHCERTLEALPRFANADLMFEPGTQFRYSSFGWILMSAAVEAAAHESFGSFMRQQVFEPLGMRDTKADEAAGPMPDTATFYFPRFAADPRYGPQDPSEVDYSCFSGSSAFLSTPSDLVRFGLAINGGKLLRPDTVKMLQTAQRLPTGQDTGYGLGWDLETATIGGTPMTVVGHDGTLVGGMVASLITVPDRGLVVAVTSNTAYADTFALGVKVASVMIQAAPATARLMALPHQTR